MGNSPSVLSIPRTGIAWVVSDKQRLKRNLDVAKSSKIVGLMQPLLEIKTEVREGYGLLRLFGDVTSDAEEALQKAQSSLPAENRNKLVLDLNQTHYINSAGIAAFIGLLNRVNDAGGVLRMAGLNKHFKKVIDTVGLSDYISIFDTVEEAIKG